MKTKDKIILASCELFNQHGERAITTNHIAAHLGISPGNLYYHFRNKEDIIRSIYSEYESYILEAFRPYDVESESDLGFMVRYLDGMFKVMWRYRFFYANLADILNRDQELRKRYIEVQKKMDVQSSSALRILRDNGTVVLADIYIADLAQTLKMIITCWIGFQSAQKVDGTVSKDEIYQGVLRVLTTFRGYISDKARPEFDRIEAQYRQLLKQVETRSEASLADESLLDTLKPSDQ
ncbi:DNA-binding transcriptional regulator, AcrR family [Ferrimonas sediminum]|uniref:DNA-binding transcriptional regulator, AcrR family n=1 Tax=Ferrimonas sediminum TaxID=718193 RepID=A0A1G8ZP39_9GAMM|nr:TetR/AcrR family transcriptional regulator [Ferrimonas sediminum]SDK16811.1 DNA-binding transcriptional regulator, AcrR family [Ferrimonas sediminum]